MKLQATKRPECREDVEQARSEGSLVQKIKAVAAKVFCWLLLRPVVWRWLIGHIPQFVEKVEVVWNQAVSWFTDLF